MPTATTCIYKNKLISIDEALDIRGGSSETLSRGTFTCTECGSPVKPMKCGGHSSAHFVHFSRNPSCSLSHNFVASEDELSTGINELVVRLTDGAITNGYIRIPSNQTIFDSDYIAVDEDDSHASLFTLVDDSGDEIETCIVRNRGRLKKRFTAYFKSRNINPGTLVKFTKLGDGKYRMNFNAERKTIKELYEEYKANPRNDWKKGYRERCEQLAEYKDKSPEDYDVSLLKDIWLTPRNGIANASPGFMNKLEFEELLDDLPAITSKIVQAPSPETLDEVILWAKQAKEDAKFKSIKWGVIHRVFSAADPYKYSSIINETYVQKLIAELNKLYNLGISTKGNWVDLNINLMKAIKAEGLQDEDVYTVNTFVWTLYQSLVEKKSQVRESNDKEASMSVDKEDECMNMIYYGPPGTGKTYELQKMLREEYTDSEILPDDSLWLNDQLEDLSWYEVIALVLLDTTGPMKVTDIISHPFYVTKAEINERGAHLRATAWAALQNHAVLESKTVKFSQRNEPLVFNKNEDSTWFIVESEREQLEEYVTLLSKIKEGPKQADSIKRHEFVTFHQSYGYEEFIEGLRPVTNSSGDIGYEIKPGVFKRICKRAEADPDNQYAIVIDEINRGNISKIFGELITLVEVDKRIGAENALTVTLPYSGLPFGVPSNLDIIGTMNTADRSLTHIDVALRRRFDFVELRTKYSLVPDDVDGVNVKRMLYSINQRIELLLDREHILGHALLMKVRSIDDLEYAFKTNIMPLLEEYFFENWDKINQVLNNNEFIEEKKGANDTWLGDADDYVAKSFRINLDALKDIEAYKVIYSGVDPSAFAECDAAVE